MQCSRWNVRPLAHRLLSLAPRGLLVACGLLLSSCSVHVTVRDVSVCEGRDACLAALRQTVESYWRLPACARAGMKTTLGLTFPDKGPVPARILRSSGFQEFDQSALLAVRLASGDIATRGIGPALGAEGGGAVELTLVAAADGQAGAPACAASFVNAEPPAGRLLTASTR